MDGSHRSALPARSWVMDIGLAAVLLAANLADLFAGALDGVYPGSVWAHLPFVVATSVPIAFRRRSPLVALVVFAVLQSVWIFGLFPYDQQPPLIPFVELFVMVYSAGAYTLGRSAQAAIVVLALGVATDIPTLLAGKPLGDVAGPDVALLVAFAFGLLVSRLRGEATEHRERAEQAERLRAVAAEQAAAEERARIARELHDVITHDVSLMVLQASVERHVRGEDDGADQALASIESTGREALAELRRMLGVLRKSDPDAGLSPQPGMAELPRLVDQARDAGLPVSLLVEGDPVPVPPGLDIAVYRIVQEALTNVAKHAAGAATRTTVRYGHDCLDLEVVNEAPTGRALNLPDGGHGLAGIRERVALFGGALEAAPHESGGFRLHAVLPLAAS